MSDKAKFIATGLYSQLQGNLPVEPWPMETQVPFDMKAAIDYCDSMFEPNAMRKSKMIRIPVPRHVARAGGTLLRKKRLRRKKRMAMRKYLARRFAWMTPEQFAGVEYHTGMEF